MFKHTAKSAVWVWLDCSKLECGKRSFPKLLLALRIIAYLLLEQVLVLWTFFTFQDFFDR